MTNTNNNLPVLLEDFLTYSRVNLKAESTIKGYVGDLSLLFKFIKTIKTDTSKVAFKDINISDVDIDFIKSITKINITAFQNFLMTKTEEKTGHKSNTGNSMCRKLANIKTFYEYLQNEAELITPNENIVLNLKKPKIEKRAPIYLTEIESKDMLSNMDVNDFNYDRDFCIITLLLNCGLRDEEVSDLNIEHIQSDNILRVVGKGNKERHLSITPALRDALDMWLEERKYRKVLEGHENALFISQKGSRLSNKSVANVVKKYREGSGADKSKISKLTTHKLRHTFATLVYKNGDKDIRSLQELLGHASITSTEIYAHVDNEDKKKAINSSPMSNFKVNSED